MDPWMFGKEKEDFSWFNSALLKALLLHNVVVQENLPGEQRAGRTKRKKKKPWGFMPVFTGKARRGRGEKEII